MAVVVAVAVLAGAAAAVRAQQAVSYFGMAFPERIGGTTRGEPHDFESRTRGLGYSVRYSAPGWLIDVFIYDLRRDSIPADPTADPVAQELLQATGDVMRRPHAKGIRIKLRYALLDDRAHVRLLCTSFTYTERDVPTESYLCVTSWKNKFIKYRLSTRNRGGSDAAAHTFVRAWIPLLWPS